jgi:hypothetical protein
VVFNISVVLVLVLLIDSHCVPWSVADFCCRELRQMVAQLRQDNTELRHRMRQAESRSAKALNNSMSMNSTASLHGATGLVAQGTPSGVAAINAELATTNAKLRKQIDALKRELEQLSQAHEKLRADSAREISKWKLRITSGLAGAVTGGKFLNDSSALDLTLASGNSAAGTEGANVRLIAQLRSRVLEMDKELRLLRSMAGTPGSNSRVRTFSGTTPQSSSSRPLHFNPYATSRLSASTASSSARRPVSAGAAWGSRSTTPPMTRRRDGGLLTSTAERLDSRLVSRSPLHISGSGRIPQAAPPLGRSMSATSRPRSVSPALGGAGSSSSSSAVVNGNRFDPTAYAREQQMRRQSKSPSAAWGSGPGTPFITGGQQQRRGGAGGNSAHRYGSPAIGGGESGYVSSHSQVSILRTQ